MKVQPTTKQLIAMLYERLPEIFHRPQRPWVGLTEEEFDDLQIENIDDPWANFKAIEAKLKEKNT
jgi:hypothetical protein